MATTTVTITHGTITDTAGRGRQRTVWVTDHATGRAYRYTGAMAWAQRAAADDPVSLTASTDADADPARVAQIKRPRGVRLSVTTRAHGMRAYAYTAPDTGRTTIVEHPANAYFAVLRTGTGGTLRLSSIALTEDADIVRGIHTTATVVPLHHIDRPLVPRGAAGATLRVKGFVTQVKPTGEVVITDASGYRYHADASQDAWTASLAEGTAVEVQARVAGHATDRVLNRYTVLSSLRDVRGRRL